MQVRDLLVVLDGSSNSGSVLAVAVDLAQRHDAHLTGFCPLENLVVRDPRFAMGVYPGIFEIPSMLEEIRARATNVAAEVEENFREQLRRGGINGDWQLATGLATEALVRSARCKDLLILPQANPEAKEARASRVLIEDALMGSGRPLLLVPYAGKFEMVGRNVLVGWDGSREAARAVHDMLPMIETSAKITLLTVERARGASDADEVPGAQIAEHLARHELTVNAARTVRESRVTDADALLGYACDIGADLIVIGGYGHSRTREIFLGGVTRALLAQMIAPVLMSR
ncbi:MAG TPA: universal stress protein [Acetobacteraceae bacterium]|nr:universal stress protein [Acetobacteraceae bacterium]